MSDIKFKVGDKVEVIDNPNLPYSKCQRSLIGQQGIILEKYSENPIVKFGKGLKMAFGQGKLKLVQDNFDMEIETRYHVRNRSFSTLERAKRFIAMEKIKTSVEEEFGEDYGTYPAFLDILRKHKTDVIEYLNGLENND